ncbi:hypothetical protein CAJAP_01286 [Camponotus japonicus]
MILITDIAETWPIPVVKRTAIYLNLRSILPAPGTSIYLVSNPRTKTVYYSDGPLTPEEDGAWESGGKSLEGFLAACDLLFRTKGAGDCDPCNDLGNVL